MVATGEKKQYIYIYIYLNSTNSNRKEPPLQITSNVGIREYHVILVGGERKKEKYKKEK